MSKKLNLGCGEISISGFIGVDKIKTPAVEVIHDLNSFPYPFKDDSVNEILLDNVLEHLDNVIGVMEELHRISKDGALIKIRVPYFKSTGAFTDPTHKHFFTESSFKYFEKGNIYHYYTDAEFETVKMELVAQTKHKDIGHFLRNLLPLKKVLKYFLFNIYDEIYFELKCIK